jgi:phosphatidylserine/phosphatidylglycerophosphate/cardiolipin synthase-like enzyme
MYGAAGRPLAIQEVRAALTAAAAPPSHVEATRVGAGCLDVAAAVDAVRPRGGTMGTCACNSGAVAGGEAFTAVAPAVGAELAAGCLPGEGPPGPEPDATGRALHPTISRGTTPARSRRPAVGYAQQCLGNWMAAYRDGTVTCPSQAVAYIDAELAELARTGQRPPVVDCRFGPATQRAVEAFQACEGLDRDGVVGRATWPRLVRFASATPTPSTTTPGTKTPPTVEDPVTRRWRQVLGPDVRYGNEVVDLIDGPETFRALAAAIRTATRPGHYVYLLAWWLDIGEPLDVPATNRCDPGRHSHPSILRNLLATKAEAGVQVRAVLWDRSLSTKNDAEARFIDGLPNGGAFTDDHQLASTLGSQHQKVLIVYGSEGLLAFCGGVDINCDRICATCPPGGSGGSSGAGGAGSPQHDVHCRIKGPAAHDLLRVFIKRWFSNREHRSRDARTPLLGLSTPPPPPAGRALVRVGETYNATATMPGGATVRFRDRTVQDILLRVIAGARRYIYIEEQYMIGLCAAEALRRALPRVEHVTILTAPSEISDVRRPWEFRREFIDHVRRGPQGHKLHVFVRCTRRDGTVDLTDPHCYVHAKTLIADDEVAVIGSANINRRGWEHDAEVVAGIVGPGRAGAPLARDLRTRLWAEHLGVTPAQVADPVASHHLWTSAPARQVCVYDPLADTDPLANRFISRDIIDPGDPLSSAPCCRIHGPSCPGGRSPTTAPLVASRRLVRT